MSGGLDVFVRLLCRAKFNQQLEAALQDVIQASRTESGCLSIHAYGPASDGPVYYIHSRWKDEEAFELHATLPHVLEFLRITDDICESREVTRTKQFDQ